MTDRCPLGTGFATAETARTRDTDPPAPRAPLAAERLPADPAVPVEVGSGALNRTVFSASGRRDEQRAGYCSPPPSDGTAGQRRTRESGPGR
ncbi:hypothetical protein [Streptomyces sp. NPDC018347]|uniref:hypothetical protein n=1 Tax=Streptomyces sp. NPDC018347 TaxID=3157193 RepID=UPI0033D3CB96